MQHHLTMSIEFTEIHLLQPHPYTQRWLHFDASAPAIHSSINTIANRGSNTIHNNKNELLRDRFVFHLVFDNKPKNNFNAGIQTPALDNKH